MRLPEYMPVRTRGESFIGQKMAATTPQNHEQKAGLEPAGCCARVCIAGICHCVHESPLC